MIVKCNYGIDIMKKTEKNEPETKIIYENEPEEETQSSIKDKIIDLINPPIPLAA